MKGYLLLMHGTGSAADWDAWFELLQQGQHLVGGSSVAAGTSLRKGKALARCVSSATGYLVIRARDLRQAKALVRDNPVHLAGGTVTVHPLD